MNKELLLKLLLEYSDEKFYDELGTVIFRLKRDMGHRDCRACGGFRAVYKDGFCSKDCLEKYQRKEGDIFWSDEEKADLV